MSIFSSVKLSSLISNSTLPFLISPCPQPLLKAVLSSVPFLLKPVSASFQAFISLAVNPEATPVSNALVNFLTFASIIASALVTAEASNTSSFTVPLISQSAGLT
jgi:hypothetical protein